MRTGWLASLCTTILALMVAQPAAAQSASCPGGIQIGTDNSTGTQIPMRAEAAARRACTERYGQCVAVTRCSGRRSYDVYPSGKPRLRPDGIWVE